MNANIASPISAMIFQAWQNEGRAEKARTYLGASIVGHACDMCLWLQFRGAVREDFDGRTYRLFDRGKREEAVFCDDLRRIGCEVREFDKDGQQFSVSDFGGHFGGHLDGIARGLPGAPKAWHVVEFKTHSDSSFRKLCKEGVAKAKPMHFSQMQVYMGKTGLENALYMAVNKDNDDLWCERVKFDKAHFDRIMARAKHLIDTCSPDRCASRPDDFRCKGCACHSVCWHTASTFVDPSVPLSCRTCCHATADTEHDGAAWTCRLGHSCSTLQGACKDYLILPAFVKGEVMEGDESGILYSFETDGITIGKRGVSAEEAKKFGPAEARGVLMVKESVPGAAVTGSNDLAVKYADREKYAVVYDGKLDGLGAWTEAHPVSDFTKPVREEAFGGVRYFEYANDVLVTIDGTHATVTLDNPPF